jgi:hypothetical protein
VICSTKKRFLVTAHLLADRPDCAAKTRSQIELKTVSLNGEAYGASTRRMSVWAHVNSEADTFTLLLRWRCEWHDRKVIALFVVLNKRHS